MYSCPLLNEAVQHDAMQRSVGINPSISNLTTWWTWVFWALTALSRGNVPRYPLTRRQGGTQSRCRGKKHVLPYQNPNRCSTVVQLLCAKRMQAVKLRENMIIRKDRALNQGLASASALIQRQILRSAPALPKFFMQEPPLLLKRHRWLFIYVLLFRKCAIKERVETHHVIRAVNEFTVYSSQK